MDRARMRFSLMLPLLELSVWFVLVLGPFANAYLQIEGQPRRGARMAPGAALARAAYVAVTPSRNLIAALNLPGMLVEVAISGVTTWPDEWHPALFSVEVWRGFTLPLYCLPAWWLAGRGLDSLVWLRRIHGAWVLLALVLSLLCGLCVMAGVVASVSDREFDATTGWLLAGFWLWMCLFACSPVHWLGQRVQKRRERASARKHALASER